MSARVEAARERVRELDRRRAKVEEQLEKAAARLESRRAALARATADRHDTMVLRAEVAGLVEEVEALRSANPLLDSRREAAAAELDRAEMAALAEEHASALSAALAEVDAFLRWFVVFLATDFAPRWIRVTGALRASVQAESALAVREDRPLLGTPEVLRHWSYAYPRTYAVLEEFTRKMDAFGVRLDDPAIQALAALRDMPEEQRRQIAAAVERALGESQPEGQLV